MHTCVAGPAILCKTCIAGVGRPGVRHNASSIKVHLFSVPSSAEPSTLSPPMTCKSGPHSRHAGCCRVKLKRLAVQQHLAIESAHYRKFAFKNGGWQPLNQYCQIRADQQDWKWQGKVSTLISFFTMVLKKVSMRLGLAMLA